MGITQKVLLHESGFVNRIKEWCNNKFALSGHTHLQFNIYIKEMNWRGPDGYWILFSNNFCIQGGVAKYTVSDTGFDVFGSVTFTKPYKDLGYLVFPVVRDSVGGAGSISAAPSTKNTFKWKYDHSGKDDIRHGTGTFAWETKGFI